ncbi:hypothetical protein CARUB_v10011188mg [Capsella rubella]|uniref:Transmembrane protein n=1 Tax=Capsella rubella TaxID=81985 RepID=R0GL79_9BRAS|nr:uncharacterized protein LOC17900597 [Capsella rubella]EOA36501.1 hypothetical protein CARUB_v10011188mg [Capsella rubella]
MKMEEDLDYINILKRATKLLCGNINLVIFLFLCSLPLFCFLIFFELSLQSTVSLASQYLVGQLDNWSYYDVRQDDALSENLIPLLIQTFLLYLFPYSLLDLLTTSTVVSASWIVHMSGEEPLKFGRLVRRTLELCQNRIEGCLITSLYVLLMSTPVFCGFFFVATNYFYIISLIGFRNYSYYYYEYGGGYYSSFNDPVKMLFDAVLAMFHVALFLFLLAKFSTWTSGWNMGLVVSVLEEGEDGQAIYGPDALTLSAYYGKGHEERGLRVMLVFLVFAMAMRMPCFCFKCTESSNGVRVLYTSFYVGLICVGNVIKWVACLVFYEDCRTRFLVKKGDLEIGSKAKALVAQPEIKPKLES